MATDSDEEIYQKHRDDLIRYASVMVGRDRAEDVLSSVLVRALAGGALGRFEDARPYLFRAVLNEARSVLRARRTVKLPEAVADLATHDIELLDLVLRLPPRQRAVIYLVYWEGHTIASAADLMGASPGTLKRYLHLARSRLRGVL